MKKHSGFEHAWQKRKQRKEQRERLLRQHHTRAQILRAERKNWNGKMMEEIQEN